MEQAAVSDPLVSPAAKTPWIAWVQAAVICIAGWLVYAPALRGGWLWDDDFEIRDNASLRTWAGLARIWAPPEDPDYYPLKGTVRWLQWHAWGDHVLGYHLTNLVLHLAAGFLLWRLLGKLGAAQAWLGGLLFVVHPLAVESVAWMSELKNTLSLPPFLLSIICLVSRDSARATGERRRLYWLSLVWFVAAMVCKSSAAMLPAVLLLYAWWKKGRLSPSDLKESLPFFCVSLALGAVTLWFQGSRAIGGLPLELGGALARTVLAGKALLFYFRKALWPSDLLPLYPRWSTASPSAFQLWPWAVLVLLGIWLFTRRTAPTRAAALGLGFFVITALPILGFVPMAYEYFSRVADHLVYLPLVGLAGLAGAAAGALVARTRSWVRACVFAFVAVVCGALVFSSRTYATHFADAESIWTYCLRGNPGSWAAENNLGYALFETGWDSEAVGHFQKCILLNPHYPDAHLNLGQALAREHNPGEAMAEFRRAIELEPNYAEAHYNLGLALDLSEHMSEAMVEYRTSIAVDPRHPEVFDSLGKDLAKRHAAEEAIVQFQKALELAPRTPEFENNLGVALATVGRYREGGDALAIAVAANPGNEKFRANLESIRQAAAKRPVP